MSLGFDRSIIFKNGWTRGNLFLLCIALGLGFGSHALGEEAGWKISYDESVDLSSKGQWSSAYDLAQKSVRQSKKIFFNGKNLNYALCLSNFAGLCIQLGKGDEAIDACKKAEKIFKAVYGQNDPQVGTMLFDLARASYLLKDYKKSESYFESALDIYQKNNSTDPDWVPMTYMNLGYAYLAEKDYKNLLNAHTKALEFYDRNFPENTLQKQINKKPYILDQIAYDYYLLQDYEKAIQMDKESLRIYEKYLGSDNFSVATAYYNLAVKYMAAQKYNLSEKYLLKAMVFLRRHETGNELLYANVSNVYSEIYLSEKENDLAEKKCDLAKDVADKAAISGNSDWENVLMVCEKIYKKIGNEEKDKEVKKILEHLEK